MVEKDLTTWGLPANTQGLEFTFQAADGQTPIQLDLMDNDPQHNTDGMIVPMSDGAEPATRITLGLYYEKGLPTGKIPVTIYRETVMVTGQWQLQWAAPEQTGVNLLNADLPLTSQPNADGIRAELKRVVKLTDGYLFFLRLPMPAPTPAFRVIEPVVVSIVDSSGQKISLQLDAPQAFYARGENLWQFSTKEKIAPGPVKLLVEQARVRYTNFNFEDPPAPEVLEALNKAHSFVFDVGPNPQVEQTWALNQAFEIAGYKGTLTSVRAVTVDSKDLPFPELQPDASINRGYEFTIQSLDPAVQWNVSVSIDKPTDFVDCIGSLDGDPASTTTHTVTCRGLPTGQLRAIIQDVSIQLNDVWEADWNLPMP
jgi:hypothetical protein